MKDLSNLDQSKLVVLSRLKALVAALGVVLQLLYAIESAKPNHYVEVAIGILTVLGVHQVRNV